MLVVTSRIKRKKILRMMRVEARNFQGKLAPMKIITIKERYNITHPPGKLLIQDRLMNYKRENPARATRGNYRRLVILSQMFNLKLPRSPIVCSFKSLTKTNRIKIKLAQWSLGVELVPLIHNKEVDGTLIKRLQLKRTRTKLPR